ncbi:MAG: hypothetical protein RBQ72_11185, partial [Desulfobacterium sp.]|nr:hypothetical protein [Desulfobacterium sp.]
RFHFFFLPVALPDALTFFSFAVIMFFYFVAYLEKATAVTATSVFNIHLHLRLSMMQYKGRSYIRDQKLFFLKWVGEGLRFKYCNAQSGISIFFISSERRGDKRRDI